MTRPTNRLARPRRARRPRLTVHSLEDRATPAQFLVTSAADDGPGTLREAIGLANATPGADEITFDTAGLFATPQTISLATALPEIAADGGPLTVTGPGRDRLTVDGNDAVRVLSSAAPELTLTGFTIARGSTTGDGGGLRTTGVTTLDGMVVRDCHADGTGAGIFRDADAFLAVRNTTVSGNTTPNGGAGILCYYGGGLVVENSTISGNTVIHTGAYAGYYGSAGFFFYGSPSDAPPAGFTAGAVVIRNSTIANNSTNGSAGGIGLSEFEGTLQVESSTISGNTADATGTSRFGLRYGGGGIRGFNGDVRVVVTNSVVSGNENPDAPDLDLDRGLVDAANSAFGDPSGWVDPGGTNLIGQDLRLGPLADNGGPTPTMAPQPGSPLIDAGDATLLPADLTLDQRGFDRVSGPAVDIGAVEVQYARVTLNRAVGQADPTNGTAVDFDVEFSTPVDGFDSTDVSLAGTTAPGTLTVDVAPTGPAAYRVTVGGITGSGQVVASVPAGAATDPATGLSNLASTGTDNAVTVDRDAPTVTINQAAGQPDPTTASPIAFDVAFSEPVMGFDASDVDFTGSTVGGTLTATITPTGPGTYTVTVDGMTGVGTVVAGIPAGAAADAAGNASAASTSTDNSVEFGTAGVVRVSTATQTVGEGTVVTFTVSRTGGADGAVSIDYATVADTARAGFDFTPAAGTFTWADGEAGDQTFTVTIAADGANEGRELFSVALTNPTGGVQVGTPTLGMAIPPSDGRVIDAAAVRPGKPAALFTDGDGDLVTVKLAGKVGTATVYLTDPDGDGHGPIEWIDLAGTLADKSALSVTVKKPKGGPGDGRTTLAELSGTGLKSLTAPTTDLTGTGIHPDGYLGLLRLGHVGGGADVLLTGTPPDTIRHPAVRITAGVIGDGTDVAVANAPLVSLTAIAIGDGTITAPSVGTILVKGRAKTRTAAAIPGDFRSDLTVTGAGVGPTKPALKRLAVAGGMTGAAVTVTGNVGGLGVRGRVDGATIDVTGNVGAVSVGSFWNSRLDAGYTGANDGSGTFDAPSSVGPFRVSAKTAGFQNSFVIASVIKPVTLASITETNGGTKFGFVAGHTLAGLTITSPGQKFKFDPTQRSPQSKPGWDFEAVDRDGP